MTPKGILEGMVASGGRLHIDRCNRAVMLDYIHRGYVRHVGDLDDHEVLWGTYEITEAGRQALKGEKP